MVGPRVTPVAAAQSQRSRLDTEMLASIVIDEIQNATESIGHEAPYAFALIQGQQNNYLGYAIATSIALARAVDSYLSLGYRYFGPLGLSDQKALLSWLKWSNPDDGWYFFDFQNQIAIQNFLESFATDEDALHAECIEQLKKVARENSTSHITLGITYGLDPADFCRSVVDIYGEQGHNGFLDEFCLMRQLEANIKRD